MITSLIVVDLVYNMKLMEDCVAYVVIPGDKNPEHTRHLVVYMQQESLVAAILNQDRLAIREFYLY